MLTVSHSSCGMTGANSFKGQTRNFTSVFIVVKSTSTWSVSPGPNSPTFLVLWWSIWQHQGSSGGLLRVYSKQCAQIIIRLFLSTIAFGKLVHLQCFENNPSASTCTIGHTVGVDHHVESCTGAVAPSLPLAENAGSSTQRLSWSRPICTLLCTPEYRAVQLSCSVVVHG
jgi:hypothetical protein